MAARNLSFWILALYTYSHLVWLYIQGCTTQPHLVRKPHLVRQPHLVSKLHLLRQPHLVRQPHLLRQPYIVRYHLHFCLTLLNSHHRGSSQGIGFQRHTSNYFHVWLGMGVLFLCLQILSGKNKKQTNQQLLLKNCGTSGNVQVPNSSLYKLTIQIIESSRCKNKFCCFCSFLTCEF
jgi:hypothetical protein